jgi:putative phage-type endonuclease
LQITDLNYTPETVVDTTELSLAEWREFRRQGLGGSDAAAALGASPFMTARDLYYDKLNIAAAEDNEANWVALEVGRLLEDLVARIFHVKTGYRIYQIKKMFRHPLFPFMLANIDYFVELPDGETVILEIKTTNYNAKDKWWDGARETVPLNYEIQGRHYMAVMNMNRVYYCCLYGNNEDEAIIRRIDRDLAYESELIALEQWFWDEHVLARTPPDYTEDGGLVLESVNRHFGAGNQSAPETYLDRGFAENIGLYISLQQEKNILDRQAKEIESRMKRIRGVITDRMGISVSASCADGDTYWSVLNTPVLRPVIDKDNLARLRERLPEVYEEYATVSVSRRFSVKMKPAEQEAAA